MLGLGKRITVTVEVHGMAKQYVKAGRYELRAGARLSKLLRKAAGLGPLPRFAFMIEGRSVEPSHRLADGDVVKVLHLVGGG